MKRYAIRAVGLLCGLLVAGCATSPPPAPGSRDEAVLDTWARMCRNWYCEGFPSHVVDQTDDTLTVSINGNVRYLRYAVTGGPGKYAVQMWPTADGGRTKP